MQFNKSYQERLADRKANAAIRAAASERKAGTLQRLASFMHVIEESFKPEAKSMFNSIMVSWAEAYLVCKTNKFDEKETRRAVADYDFSVTPKHVGRTHPDYAALQRENELRAWRWERWMKSLEYRIIQLCFTDYNQQVMPYAEKEAHAQVEDAKTKLFDSVARKLEGFQTVEVESTILVKNGVKGFQGEFIIITDKGRFDFECKAVPAEGEIQRFHYRYLAHVKSL